ncbi:MAG: amylo-alpha-1,6-glucosidase [Planctomycetota bacterium]|jgi:predicted glycogen debranching enzyme
MLISQKADDVAIASISTADESVENLLAKEWLLTNERGGYASSTIVGCNTREYHGLLIGSLNPPANRIMALAKCLEMVIFEGETRFCPASGTSENVRPREVFNLSTFEFKDKLAPQGFAFLKQVRMDTGLHFDFKLDKLQLTKSVYLLRDTDTVALVYDFTGVQESVEFVLRPFIGLRDFHTLQKSDAHLCSRWLGHSLLIRHDIPGSCELFLKCPSMNFVKDKQWWFNFTYRNEKQRGLDFTEDLWTPGFFKCQVHPGEPTKIVFWANLSPAGTCNNPEQLIKADIDAVREDLRKHQNNITVAVTNGDEKLRTLCLAADQFITKRQTNGDTENTHRTTVIAGFPWFADWGRDTFISLPGLLLSTRRFDEAKSVLTTFAGAADEGMIPNRFDDRTGTAYFNSVDASLWFINAAFQYLNATGDSETFMQELLPTIRWIIDSYHNGTRFGICADADGLITAGNHETQLTWMDAKCDGVAFTPRFGKAVEVNALWYNALRFCAQFYTGRDVKNAKYYKSMAEKVKVSFRKLFWNEKTSHLNDCILSDGSVDSTLRPNQIFAVSLPFSPLSPQQQKSVVDVVQKNLLTPYGLRTLNVQNDRYKGTYAGPQQQRDEAYHQGTVWPYLIGPFVESFLKVNDFNRKSKKKAAEFIQSLMQHLTQHGCIGSISEIFDGDAPHNPRGCIAQAWSVGELIRAYQLINS